MTSERRGDTVILLGVVLGWVASIIGPASTVKIDKPDYVVLLLAALGYALIFLWTIWHRYLRRPMLFGPMRAVIAGSAAGVLTVLAFSLIVLFYALFIYGHFKGVTVNGRFVAGVWNETPASVLRFYGQILSMTALISLPGLLTAPITFAIAAWLMRRLDSASARPDEGGAAG